MSSPTTEPATGPAPSSDPASSSGDAKRPAWAEDLKKEILGAVHSIVDPLKEGGSAQSAAERRESGRLGGEADLDKMIADAIAVNDRARADDQRNKSTGDRLDKLEAAAAEKPPVQRGPLHKLMRWGEPAQ